MNGAQLNGGQNVVCICIVSNCTVQMKAIQWGGDFKVFEKGVGKEQVEKGGEV